MRRLIPLCLFLFCFIGVAAQQLPLYTQYVFNPYMLNPSLVAHSGSTELNALYRQQWANIDDGPKTLQFDAQYRTSNRMALGLYLNQDRTVMLSTTMVSATYGYRVQLFNNYTLGFGLSAGMYQNRIRSEDAAPSDQGDPALMTNVNNNIAVDGQFGMHFKTNRLMFAWSLVNLFDRKYVTTEAFQTPKLSQLKNQIIFASYRFDVMPGKLSLQPNVAYRLSENNINYYEASLVASIMKIVQVGGGYRQNFGPTAMARVSFGPIQAGFAFDFPSNTGIISPGGTKEIQVKFRFGKSEEEEPARERKKSRREQAENTTQVPAQETATEPKQEEKQPVSTTTEPKREEAPVVQQQQEQPKTEEPKVVEQPKTEESKIVEEPKVETPKVVEQPKAEQPKVEPAKTQPVVIRQPDPEPAMYYYFIINTFEDRANADKFLSDLKKRGVKAEMKEIDSPHYYYIHLPEHRATEINLDKVLELQKKTGFDNAWFKQLK